MEKSFYKLFPLKLFTQFLESDTSIQNKPHEQTSPVRNLDNDFFRFLSILYIYYFYVQREEVH